APDADVRSGGSPVVESTSTGEPPVATTVCKPLSTTGARFACSVPRRDTRGCSQVPSKVAVTPGRLAVSPPPGGLRPQASGGTAGCLGRLPGEDAIIRSAQQTGSLNVPGPAGGIR